MLLLCDPFSAALGIALIVLAVGSARFRHYAVAWWAGVLSSLALTSLVLVVGDPRFTGLAHFFFPPVHHSDLYRLLFPAALAGQAGHLVAGLLLYRREPLPPKRLLWPVAMTLVPIPLSFYGAAVDDFTVREAFFLLQRAVFPAVLGLVVLAWHLAARPRRSAA